MEYTTVHAVNAVKTTLWQSNVSNLLNSIFGYRIFTSEYLLPTWVLFFFKVFKCSLHFSGNLIFLQRNSVGLVRHNKLTCQKGSPITSHQGSFGKASVGDTLDPGFESTNFRVQVCRSKKAWLRCWPSRSAGFALQVNLRISLHTDDKAHKQGIHPGFETRGRCHKKSKSRISAVPQRGLMSSKTIYRKEITICLFDYVEVMQSYNVLIWNLLISRPSRGIFSYVLCYHWAPRSVSHRTTIYRWFYNISSSTLSFSYKEELESNML